MDSELNAGQMVSMIRDKYCDGSNIKFAEIMGESSTTVSNWCNAKTLGKQVIMKILSRFENIDANWFLLGRGNMEIQSSEIVSEDTLNNNLDMEIKTLLDVIKRQNAWIEELEKEVSRLRGECEPLKERSIV